MKRPASGAYLERALAWQRAFDAHYADPDTGGYYLSADDADDLLLRPHSTVDDATPNPNAVAAQNLLRLAVLTGDDAWRAKADRLIEGILSAAERNLFGHIALLNALDLRLRGAEIVATGPDGRALRASRAQAAVPRPHRAARGERRRPAGVASGAGEAEGGNGQRGLHLRRRALLAAGERARADRGSGQGDAFLIAAVFTNADRAL